jgi:hypothetical protein
MKKNLLLPGVMAALVALCAPAWAINKCTGPDGRMVFQDAACEGKGEKLAVRPASGESDAVQGAAPSTTDWKRQSAQADKRLAIQSAIERREAVIGMNGEQLDLAMGLPNRINTGEYQTGSTQQRIYERRGTTWYVYTDGQLVTAVQTSITSGTSSRAVACPTAHDIRSAETSASSITLSEAERVERLKQIRDMRNCGR